MHAAGGVAQPRVAAVEADVERRRGAQRAVQPPLARLHPRPAQRRRHDNEHRPLSHVVRAHRQALQRLAQTHFVANQQAPAGGDARRHALALERQKRGSELRRGGQRQRRRRGRRSRHGVAPAREGRELCGGDVTSREARSAHRAASPPPCSPRLKRARLPPHRTHRAAREGPLRAPAAAAARRMRHSVDRGACRDAALLPCAPASPLACAFATGRVLLT